MISSFEQPGGQPALNRSISQYPAPSTTATARAYDWFADQEHDPKTTEQATLEAGTVQASLFPEHSIRASESRVVPFDSFTTRVERQAIRARAAGLEQQRPAPLKTESVQVKRARTTQARQQRTLEFDGNQETITPPQSSIICSAVVAPALMRLQAAAVDGALMLLPMLAGLAIFVVASDSIDFDKHLLPFYLAALVTIPVLYKVLWAIAGADTPGMRAAGLILVDFDGNPPSRQRRYRRCFSSYLSLLAAGVGLIWSLVDEDGLTWHDHISSTFPTVV